MTKLTSKTSISALCISLLFAFSSVSVPTVIAAANSSPAALAATPLAAIQANWASPDGNQFNWNFNPQTQINSSNAQNLGLSWLFPLPTHPAALLSVSGGLGVDTSPLIINGTIYTVTQYGQVFALNAANGNVLWTDILPIQANSTSGLGIASLNLHLHQGEEAFTTSLFGNTPTYWVSAPDQHAYAINALNGKYEMNFSFFKGVHTVSGNNPISVYAGLASNIQIDEKRGIMVTSILSSSSNNAARCFYRGWNILVNPPTLMWESYCSPPQPGSNVPVDPNWDAKQVADMTGAQIFYPGPAYNGGGNIPSSGVVDLKKLSAAQLNSTLYNDWGYVQSPACAALDGGASPGATGAGWGAPWLLDQKTGIAYVNTGNRGPYVGPCNPGPLLWQASVLAINDQTGQWVWGFQTSAHDEWDWDCSWYQALGNETINGVQTEVLWKTCKNGYLYELNAANGNMIWAWTPPSSITPRCAYCYIHNPLNQTQMTEQFFNPTLQPTMINPSFWAGFESDAAYSPASNYIFVGSHNVPQTVTYIPFNASNYGKSNGEARGAVGTAPYDNSSIIAVNAATGQMVWSHYIPTQGIRGGLTVSGNVVYVTLSSGDMLMLNAQTGTLIKDFYIGGPLNVLPSVGATSGGQMEIVFPITAGAVSWGTGVPGDIVALTLQSAPTGAVSTVTSTSVSTIAATHITTTSTTTVTAAGSGGVGTTTAYGIAAVAVIFIIATGYLAMTRGRKPAS